jgi:hypothetical protein
MPRHFEGELRLSDASSANQGDEPMVGHEADHLVDLDVSADQIRCRRRDVRRRAADRKPPK